MKNFLNWFNEKKTVIGIMTAGVLTVIIELGYVSMSDSWVQVVIGAVSMWTGVAVAHKIQKRLNK